MKLYTLTGLYFILIFFSCKKENEESKQLELVWQKLLHLDSNTGVTIEPFLLDNGVLFSSDLLEGDYRGYYLMNKNNGNIIWHWKDNLIDIESHTGANKIAASNGKLIINDRRQRYCINYNTGETIWKYRNEWDFGSEIVQKNNLIYSGRYQGYNTGQLVNYTFDDPTPTVLYQNPTDSNNMREYNHPPAFTEQNGDTWMVFSDGFVNYDSGKGHPWLVCYNLTADSLIWRRQVSDAWFHAGIDIPIINNNRIYLVESFHVVCLDLFTGEEIWRRTQNGAFFTGGILIAENKLFAMCENLKLYVHDLDNGSIIHTEDNNGSGTKMHYHKGKIYYVGQGDGLLHCIDAATGKHLWTMEGPKYKNDRDLFFDNAGIAIDPDTDYLYITDYRYAYCYEILD